MPTMNEYRQLSDFPVELLTKIVKESDLPVRIALRKVSKFFRNFVDNQKPNFNHFGITIDSTLIELNLDGCSVYYKKFKKGGTLVGTNSKTKPKRLMVHPMDALFNDLTSFMSKPNLHFNRFEITFTDANSYRNFSKRFIKLVKSRISVHSLFINVHNFSFFERVSFWFFYRRSEVLEYESVAEEDEDTMRHDISKWVRIKEEKYLENGKLVWFVTYKTRDVSKFYSKETGQEVQEEVIEEDILRRSYRTDVTADEFTLR